MTLQSTPLRLAPLGLAAMLTLSGCGGGSSSQEGQPAASTTPAAPVAVAISGTAATGAPFAGATVSVTDARGVAVASGVTVGTDGSYQTTLAEGATAPFVVAATRTSPDGVVDTLVSVLDTAKSATVNITPVTTLVASRLSASGDPLKLAAEVKAGTATVDTTTVAAKVDEVKTLLKPLLDATGTAAIDPIKGSFNANGSGVDRLLDSVKITITPASSSSANIEVAYKVAAADPAAQPPVIQFESKHKLSEITANASNQAALAKTVEAESLVPDGTAPLVEDLIKRLNTCYALPLTSRVKSGGTQAADVLATECRTLFIGDDPATWLNNGNLVAKGQSFSGLFNDSATELKFDRGSFEFKRPNGDLVVSYRTTTTAGNVSYEAFAARLEGGKLKAIGNQYRFHGDVSPKHQLRLYPTADQAGYANWSTGYVLNVNDKLANGVSIYDRVQVTAPDGTVLTLVPTAGSSQLNLKKTGFGPTTNYLRLRWVYSDTAKTGSPVEREPYLVSAGDTVTDADVAKLPAQSVWSFAYYLKTDPTTPAAVQTFRTRARALTIAELQTKSLAQLTEAGVSYLTAPAATRSDGRVDLGGTFGFGNTWSVPEGAIPPKSIWVDGVKVNPSTGITQHTFNDSAAVASTARTGLVYCNPATVADVHCTWDGTRYNYADGAQMTQYTLIALDGQGREFATAYVTRKFTY